MVSGGEPDWSAAPPPVPEDWAGAFRSSADDLIHLWHQKDDGDAGADWQTAEFAVHTWDLARATGSPPAWTRRSAERALAFMSQSLTPENRGGAFGPEVSVPDDAPVYERLGGVRGPRPELGAADRPDVAVARYGDAAVADRRFVLERAFVGPALALVEPARPGVAGRHGEPGPRVAARGDQPLGLGEQQPGHPAAAVTLVDVDLVDLVVEHHHEPRHLVVDGEW